MIVHTMTHEEACKEIERDEANVTRWRARQIVGLRRRVLKNTRFPFSRWMEYVSPRKNRYIYYVYITEKHMRRVMAGVIAIRQEDDGLTAYVRWGEDYMVVIPHAFKRYAERMGIDKHGIELIKHYFENNLNGKEINDARLVGRSVRWNGDVHKACCVPDGVLLGQVTDTYFIVRTFITYEMCSGIQRQKFDDSHHRVAEYYNYLKTNGI